MITQGKWKVERWSPQEAQIVAHHEGKRSLICAGVMREDAHLMGASKELLAACLAAEDFLATIQTEAALAIYHQLHAAIAKARNTPALHVEVL